MVTKTLVIDDDEISLFLTTHLLQVSGFSSDIRSFTSSEVALKELIVAIEKGEPLPEIIFLDLNMPVLQGWDILDKLRSFEQELVGKVRVYILTSSTNLDEYEKAKEYPMVSGFLNKPLDENHIDFITSAE